RVDDICGIRETPDDLFSLIRVRIVPVFEMPHRFVLKKALDRRSLAGFIELDQLLRMLKEVSFSDSKTERKNGAEFSERNASCGQFFVIQFVEFTIGANKRDSFDVFGERSCRVRIVFMFNARPMRLGGNRADNGLGIGISHVEESPPLT